MNEITADEKTRLLTNLVMTCAYAVISGSKTVTFLSSGRWPAGFPRGEISSVANDGKSTFAVNPIKVLAWVHALTSKMPIQGAHE